MFTIPLKQETGISGRILNMTLQMRQKNLSRHQRNGIHSLGLQLDGIFNLK